MNPAEYKNRIKRLDASLGLAKSEAFFVSRPVNVRYLTGFEGSDSFCLVTSSGVFFITDFRFKEEARRDLKGIRLEVRKPGEPLFERLKHIFRRERLKTLFFEHDGLSYADYIALRKFVRPRKIEGKSKVIEALRSVKSESEIALIRKSLRITEGIFAKLIRRIKPGVTELDLAHEAEYLFRSLGGEVASFPPIVAFGPRTSQPHARPRCLAIGRRGILILDIGTTFKGYCSDLTRTFFLGKMTPKFERFYRFVRESQNKAIERVKAGVTIGEIDYTCRSFLKKHGLARFFGHSLGHGVGLEVHENPTIFYTNRRALEENMVLTIEPGVYIEGWGGIRIEDMIRVTRSGCELLSTVQKEAPEILR
ncbi:MAG: Xaa-Pro peptidase family protein [Candidatus Omnitrophica bacterium]|nr:Xaa-Pro peptidase family protein [Candidatus Omnitrophota bacterium]